MIENKFLLPNGNVLLWIPGKSKDKIENILILAGGDVLLLKSIKHISMLHSYYRDDVLSLPFNDFIKKYKLEEYKDIYYDLIKELKKGNYPTYDKNYVYDYIVHALKFLYQIKGKDFDDIRDYIISLLNEYDEESKKVIITIDREINDKLDALKLISKDHSNFESILRRMLK